MPYQAADLSDPTWQNQMPPSRWDNEGRVSPTSAARDRMGSGRSSDNLRLPRRLAPLRAAAYVALLLMCSSIFVPRAFATVPEGVWLMDEKVAIQVFDCENMLCAQVIWLKAPFDPQGTLRHDRLNPDRALRQRQVCGSTIIWNAHQADSTHWKGGWFYNPDDGTTYRVKMQLRSPDMMVARIYSGIPLFGKTRTLVRIPMGVGAGWC